MKKPQENLGSIFVLSQAILWGMFPVIVNQGAKSIAPLTFAALSTLLASAVAFIYLSAQKKWGELKNKEAYKSIILLTLCIVIIPYSLFFLGASKTSGVNSSILLLSEIIFTLIFTHFIGEKTTVLKLIGSLGIFLGALLILYNGTFNINSGDILIILSTLTYPIGNYYSKKALNIVSPATILFSRFLLGGIFLLLFSLLFEKGQSITPLISEHWKILLFNGVAILGISKLLWYKGLKLLDISKAIALAMTFPLFSLIALVTFYNETISLYQGVGITIMMVGVYFSLKRKSVEYKNVI